MGEELCRTSAAPNLGRGLLIRFKTAPESVNPPAPAGEICHLCKNEFKSKKALWGHSRVHGGMGAVAAAAATAAVSREAARPSDDLSTGKRLTEDQVRFRCTICGNDFRSEKAVQGHMRMHPDRDWRGMQPPSSSNRSSAVNGSESTIVGPVLNLAGSVAATESSWSTSTEEYYLGFKKADGIDGQVIKPLGSGSGSTGPRPSSEKQRTRPLSDSTDRARNTKSRTAHHRCPEQSDETEIRINRHECEKCKRRFPTGQALGGHKRKHWTGPPRETREHEIPGGQRKLPLDFDLNELPPMEEDDQEAVEPAYQA